MSFFGFDATLPERRDDGFGDKAGAEDVAVYTWGTEAYDGLGDQLQEQGDDTNDLTFGGGDIGQSEIGKKRVRTIGSRSCLRSRRHRLQVRPADRSIWRKRQPRVPTAGPDVVRQQVKAQAHEARFGFVRQYRSRLFRGSQEV